MTSVQILLLPNAVIRAFTHFACLSGEGEYAEAEVAYDAAGDQESVVRLQLDRLKSPHKAAALVRKGGSRAGAQRLAQYCLSARDYQVSPYALHLLRRLVPWSCSA